MGSKIARIGLIGWFVCACTWLPAATTRLELADEVYHIPAGEWKWIPVELRQEPATVMASYIVEDGSGKVRIALYSRDDLEHMQDDAILAGTAQGKSGGFAYRVRDRDSYAIVVDNRTDKTNPATVRLRVSLDFARPRVTELPPERKATVIAVSFLVFFTVVTYSARKLLKAARR